MGKKIDEKFVVKSTRETIKIPELTFSEYLYQKISGQDPERIALVSKFLLKIINFIKNISD